MFSLMTLMLLGQAATGPCERLSSLTLPQATITSAAMVPAGPFVPVPPGAAPQPAGGRGAVPPAGGPAPAPSIAYRLGGSFMRNVDINGAQVTVLFPPR